MNLQQFAKQTDGFYCLATGDTAPPDVKHDLIHSHRFVQQSTEQALKLFIGMYGARIDRPNVYVHVQKHNGFVRISSLEYEAV
jgi:hypothetical protein